MVFLRRDRMLPPGGSVWMGNSAYEWFGKKNVGLMDKAKEMYPTARGEKLCVVALQLLGSEHATRAKESQNIGNYIKKWVDNEGGKMPSQGQEGGRQVNNEDMLWVGLAVIMASSGIYYLLKKAPNEKTLFPDVKTQGHNGELYYAAVISGKHIRECVEVEKCADVVIRDSTHWWVGNKAQWGEIQDTLELRGMGNQEASDDVLLICTFRQEHAVQKPSNRILAAESLRKSTEANQLKLIGMFEISGHAKLVDSGFRK